MASANSGKGLTVSGLWIDGIALLRLHLSSVIWIAAMFMFLPQLAVEILMPKAIAPDLPSLGPLVGILVISIVALVGQLASISILLGGPSAPLTVGAAIQRGFQSMPRALLALLLILGCVLPVALVLGAAAAALGVTSGQMAKPSGSFTILVLAVAGLMLFGAARLWTLNSTVVSEQFAAWACVQRAWAMTSGTTWVLAGFMLSLLLALASGTGLLKMVSDVVVSLLFGKAVIGKLVVGSLLAAVSTMFSLLGQSAAVVAYRALAK